MKEINRLTFRPTEAAEALGYSRSKTYEMIASGEIPSIELGGCRRVPVDILRQLIAKKLAERE